MRTPYARELLEKARDDMRIHKEGLTPIALFWIAALLLAWLWWPLGVVGSVVALWSIWFFRDPERTPPATEGAILSPADGLCLPLCMAPPPEELGMGTAPMTRISIFMNVFDVHVNRSPAAGTVEKTAYHPGRFFNASLDKASLHNERLGVRLRLEEGGVIAFVQIAGLVARRIRSSLGEGDSLRAGERFGLIRFGSRVDVYLPAGYEVVVREGDRVRAGETILARRLAPAKQESPV